ncbi:MAG TPA: hypothetical protein VFH68_17000 [Polyangia bacterium]|jgi:tetratricopeptide (TPR) repeat protein|nr:hypothetical protein [Polyangia bacterium]
MTTNARVMMWGLLGAAVATIGPADSARAESCPRFDRADGARMAEQWMKAPKTSRVNDCLVEATVDKPELATQSIDRLIKLATKEPRALGAATQVANGQCDGEDRCGPDRAELFLSIAAAAAQSGNPELAAPALQKVIDLSARGAVAPLEGDHARFALAAARAQQGRNADALRLWQQVADNNAGSTQSIELSIATLEAGKQADEVRALCERLATDNRREQLAACLRRGRASFAEHEDEWVRLTVQTGSQFGSDAQREQVTRDSSLFMRMPGVLECTRAAGQPPIDWDRVAAGAITFRGAYGWGQNLPFAAQGAGLFLGLANANLDSEVAHCYLACAALTCLSDLRARRTCDSPVSLARYAENLAQAAPSNPTAKDELGHFIQALFAEKMTLYDEISRVPNNAAYTALFHLHIALAHAFAATGDGPRRFEKQAYHAERARRFWSLVNQAPFPKGILPASLEGH